MPLTGGEERRIWDRAIAAEAPRPYDVLHAMVHLLWYWSDAPDDTRESTVVRRASFMLGENRPHSAPSMDDLHRWEDDLLEPLIDGDLPQPVDEIQAQRRLVEEATDRLTDRYWGES